ncbi:MAG: TPR repeat-containing protein YrrB [Pelotomaculum sp. PtaB.Bin104]|nr:MAG: TPR repeat-containing protein YrrB [Pelotomaculum sp. PtaB.Bin104]
MKRHVVILVVIALVAALFSFTCAALAGEADIKVMLDGEILTFDQNPIMQNDRVLVPLRKIFEALNTTVSWEPETQTITAVKEGTTVKLTVGLTEAFVNNLQIKLDQPPLIVNDRTLVPLRFVAEALGADVVWDGTTSTVKINSKQEEVSSGEQNISEATKAIALNPADPKAYNNRGDAYLDLGQYEKAITDYSKAIELDPESAEAYLKRGLAYGKLGQYKKAITDYSRAIEMDPESAEAYLKRGLAYGKLGQYEKAITDFSRAIELDPKYAEAYLLSGLAYGSLGQYEKAITDNSKAIELDPEYAEAYYYRGLAYGSLGQYEKAITDFCKAIELDPKYAEAYYYRGLVYARLGQYDKAIVDYKKALDVNPSFSEAREALKKFGVSG